MISIGPAGFNARPRIDTLQLLKPSGSNLTSTTVKPTVQVASGNQLSIIADLAAKLINLKNGEQETASATLIRSPRIGDGIRPLTTEEREMERARKLAFYQKIDDDTQAHFDKKVTDLLLQNDLYKNDPSFQAALKDGTVSIQNGEVIGFAVRPRTLIFDDNGYYAGVKGAEVEAPKDLWTKIQNIDGRFISKIDGKNVAIGQINQMSFYVTWP